jgi:hypothetical protein
MLYWRWLSRPRHPLLRVALALVGAFLLVGILVFGLFALIAFAFIGAIVAMTRAVARQTGTGPARGPVASTDPRTLDGEYVVLRNDTASLNR